MSLSLSLSGVSTLGLGLNGTGSLLHHRLHSSAIGLQTRCPLLLDFGFQVRAEGHLAVLVDTALGVIPAEKDHLFADVALTVLSFAFLGVLNDAFVAETTPIEAIGVATVDRVEKSVDASLHRLLSLVLRAGHGFAVGLITVVDHRRNRSFHLVVMFRLDVVALLAEIEVFALGAMVSHFALLPTGVAVVGELVRGGGVEFVEQGQGGELRSTQRRELVVFVPSEVQESVARVHQIALNQRISIIHRGTDRERIPKTNDKECLEEQIDEQQRGE